MLSMAQIESFYPESIRVYKRNLLREYLQYIILEIIYRSDYGRHLIFMGGTAIHILHGSQRFSEDLDFGNRGLKENDFSILTKEINKNLNLFGFQVELSTKVGNVFRCFIKFPGIQYHYGLSGHTREKLIIQLDTEPQNYDYQTEDTLINKFDIFLKIKSTPSDILLAQKLLAILKRPRTMGRDLYDAIFLFSKTTPNYRYLQEKMKLKEKDYIAAIRTELLNKVQKLDLKKLAEEIKPFLFQPEDAQRILLFPEFLTHKIK